MTLSFIADLGPVSLRLKGSFISQNVFKHIAEAMVSLLPVPIQYVS